MTDFELNMSLGSRFKLIENFHQDLSLSAVDTTGLELEFDQTDSNKFYFGCSSGLFKVDRRLSHEPTRMSIEGLGVPCSLSMSDDKYLLAGFSCGSVALYNTEFSSPMTCWYNTSTHAIKKIKWCALYFTDEVTHLSKGDSPQKHKKEEIRMNTKFATRLCEFFSIDQKEDFQIWNLNKAIHKPAHIIKFSDKHAGSMIFDISLTVADQSFFTGFALQDMSVSIYTMNFKKGSQITKEKLRAENKKSQRIMTTLPLNTTSALLEAAAAS